jgi:O-antigen ligase
VVGAGGLAVWSDERGAELFGRAASAAGLLVGAVGVLQRVGLVHHARGAFGAAWFVISTLGNSSNLGAFLVILMPLVVWSALKDRAPAARALGWSALGVCTLSLVWTLSRGAWVAALVAAVLAGVVYGSRRTSSRPIRYGVMSAVVAALVIAVAFTPTFAKRVKVLVDPGQSTASWRLSTWRSSIAMTAARPFLGYGPNNYHLAYPAFQAPGQVDGRRGYPIVESAHNLEIDTATSFGVLGLMLLLLTGLLAARTLVRTTRGAPAETDIALALGVGLLGGVVALQFHYITLDTGPLLALLLAGVINLEPALTSPAEKLSVTRGLLGVGMAAYLLFALAALGLVLADTAALRAMGLARAGAQWPTTRAELSRAESLAPWEPQVVRARGTAATQVLTKRFDAVAAVDGMRAFDAASSAVPHDAVLASERANLLLTAGIASKDRRLIEEAAGAFADAQRMDPNTGVSLAGRASALWALGRADEALATFERAVRLSPRYGPAWRNLARVYKALGREKDARLAGYKAEKWSN